MPVHRVDVREGGEQGQGVSTAPRGVVVQGGPRRSGGAGAGAARVQGGEAGEAGLCGLQRDLQRHVLSFVGARCVGTLSAASRSMRAAGADDELWGALCARDFGVRYASDGCSMRETYRRAMNELVLFRDGKPDYVEYLGPAPEHEAGIWAKRGSNGNTMEIMCAW